MAVTSIEDLRPVYLIHGKEEFLLERALRRLRGMFEAADASGMDVDVFDGRTARADEVVAAANTLPFMGPKRLVVVRDVDAMPAAEHPALVEYVSAPAAHTCLVLVGALAKNTRLYRALDAAGAVSEYASPKRSALGSWVAKAVSEKGKRIDADAADALVSATGGDLRSLDAELDKLVAYVADRDTITLEDVQSIVTASVPPVWAFSDALGARDARTCASVLHALLNAGEHPLALHAAALRRIRQLIGAKSLTERGGNAAAFARELGVQEWQARRLAQDARRFREDELASALRSAAEAEHDMKTSHGDAGLVLERWILKVCGADAPGRR